LKSNEIRNMTVPEIENKLITLKEQLFKLRAENSAERDDRPSRSRIVKKDIAKCLTILKEKASGK